MVFCDKQEDYHIRFRRSTHVTPDLIQRLGLQAELDVCLIVVLHWYIQHVYTSGEVLVD